MPVIVVAAAVTGFCLCIASQIWTSAGLHVRQRCICIVPLCVVAGVSFAALIIAMLRPEFLEPGVFRATFRSWGYLIGIVMIILGVYYAAFADDVATSQEDMVRSKHWWTRLYLRRKPHPNIIRVRAIILIVGGSFLCANAFYW